jgi:hypothetical protein
MDRVNGANTVDIGGGRRGFRDRNLVAGLPGTQVPAAHMNAVQEELLKIIEDAGLTPNPSNLAQLREGMRLLFGGGGVLAATGWQRLPGGLILQWSSVSVPAGTAATWIYPQPFATALFGVFVGQVATPSTAEIIYVASANLTQAVIDNAPGTNVQSAYVLALGI